MSAEKPTDPQQNAARPLRNAKHEAVLQAYFADPARSGFKAYLVVYPNCSPPAAQTAFSRLLRNAEFVARLQHLDAGVTAEVVRTAAVSIEQVVAELTKIGFANMENYMRVDESGAPRLTFGDLTSDHKAALQEVTCEEEIVGAGDEKTLPVRLRKTKFKLYNKHAALVSILQHLGGFPAQRHADPDGRPVGTGAVETAALSALEVARRLAFLLERGARETKKGR